MSSRVSSSTGSRSPRVTKPSTSSGVYVLPPPTTATFTPMARHRTLPAMKSLGNFPDPFIAEIAGQPDALRRAAAGLDEQSSTLERLTALGPDPHPGVHRDGQLLRRLLPGDHRAGGRGHARRARRLGRAPALPPEPRAEGHAARHGEPIRGERGGRPGRRGDPSAGRPTLRARRHERSRRTPWRARPTCCSTPGRARRPVRRR